MFSARTTNKIRLKLYDAIISLLRLFTMISISSGKFGFITARNKQVIGTSLNESPQNLATEKKMRCHHDMQKSFRLYGDSLKCEIFTEMFW